MKEGIYKIKVGEGVYILKFYKDVPSGIKVYDHLKLWVRSREYDILKLRYAQYDYRFKVLAIDPDRKFFSDLLKSSSAIKSLSSMLVLDNFAKVDDFIKYLPKHRKK